MDHEGDVGETLLAELAFGSGADVYIGEPVTSCLGGLVGGIRAVVVGSMGADQKTAELLLDASVRELEECLLPLAYQIDRLLDDSKGSYPNANDAFALGSAYASARSHVADVGMRDALRHALVNAFEPAIYRVGLTLRLLTTVAELTQGDITYLQRVIQGERERDYRAIEPGSQERGHADALLAARLVHVTGVPAEKPGSAVAGDGLVATELGEMLLQLVTAGTRNIPEQWQPPWERGADLLAGIRALDD